MKALFVSLFFIGIIVAIFLGGNIYDQSTTPNNHTRFGISFSQKQAESLGLNAHETYLSILNDLKVKKLRLVAYWDEIEKEDDKYDFKDLEFYLNEAKKHKAEVLLAVGYKVPRWPECNAPNWIDQADIKKRQEEQLEYVLEVVKKFDKNDVITAWQIENEPMLGIFGICPSPDAEFLKKEVEEVKKISQKPIVLTDSGELSNWITPMSLSDIFGTTVYRRIKNPWFGYFEYPLPSLHYTAKSAVIRKLFASNNKKTIISELQAEVWTLKPIPEVPVDEQVKNFSLDLFKFNVKYARLIQFDEAYLWGVEWWYYLKNNNHSEYLDYAKSLF